MEAVILAGGAGRRLHSVISDVPKPMADVHGKPFIAHLCDYLVASGLFSSLIISVGHMKEIIMDYFKSEYAGLKIVYAVENEPLGTGGAVALSLRKAQTDPVFVMNGDSFFQLDLAKMLKSHKDKAARLSMAVKRMTNVDRYGSLEIFAGIVQAFHEKKFCSEAMINGGIYLMDRAILSEYGLPARFSLETDFFEKNIKTLQIAAFESDGYFIDIGIPEDYAKFKDDKAGE